MSKKIFSLSFICVVLVIAALALTTIQKAHIINSQIDSTTIGASVPSTGNFNNLHLSTAVGNRVLVTDPSGNVVEGGSISTSGSGYYWVGSILVQWTTGPSLSSGQDQTVFTTSFPQVFPHGVLNVQITAKTTGTDYGELTCFMVSNYTTSNVSYYYWRNSDHGGMTTAPQIVAIGW